MPSLGQLDGAGRVVDSKPSLVFGVDNIAAEFSPTTLRIFVDHELFHRYQNQVAGFSDDKGQQEILGRGLWEEGLATYVSIGALAAETMAKQESVFALAHLKAGTVRVKLAETLANRKREPIQ